MIFAIIVRDMSDLQNGMNISCPTSWPNFLTLHKWLKIGSKYSFLTINEQLSREKQDTSS